MSGKAILSFVLISTSVTTFAGGFPRPVVLTGQTQMADTVELRFDPAPADTGTLVVLGDRSKTPAQSYRFVYDVPPLSRGISNQPVNIDFADKRTLNILCDTLSDNCRSTDYVTEGSATFSMSWKVIQR
jgi:hypothetical protein